MKTASLAVLCSVAVLAGIDARAQSVEPALNQLQLFTPASPLSTQVEVPAVSGKVLSVLGEDQKLFKLLSDLPQTDAATAKWLASRIPGLNTAALRTAPSTPVDEVLARAVARGETWLDVFSDKGLIRDNQELFFLSQSVLAQIDTTWFTGSLPIRGKASDGQPFNMQAMVLGRGGLYALYDRSSFEYNDGKNDFKIVDGGRVKVDALGAADLGISGVQVHGCKVIFCAWANIERLTKTAPTRVHVHTNKGDQDSDLKQVRRR
jgi:hypothetical protein